MSENNKKLLIVYISEILHKYTDSNHKLTQNEIAQYVKGEYGLDVERKAVARNIAALQNSGIDIASDGGYYLKSRHIDEDTITAAFIALMSSNLIGEQSATDTLSKLIRNSSNYFIDTLGNTLTDAERINGLNINYVLSILKSINAKKKISFTCPSYLVLARTPTRNGQYMITPKALYFEDGQLMLAGLNPNRLPFAFNMIGITDLEVLPSRQKNEDDMSLEELLQKVRKAPEKTVDAVLEVSPKSMPFIVSELGTNITVEQNPNTKLYTVKVKAARSKIKKIALSGTSEIMLKSPSSLQDEIVEDIISLAGIYS